MARPLYVNSHCRRLTSIVAKLTGASWDEAHLFQRAYLIAIRDELLAGRKVRLYGIGTFRQKTRKGRFWPERRNSGHHRKSNVPAHYQPDSKWISFITSRVLARKLNNRPTPPHQKITRKIINRPMPDFEISDLKS